MANALAFDTLAYARRLKEAGVDDAQAEAHAGAVLGAITEGVATKADVARLEAKIENCATKAEIKNIDVKIENFAAKAEEIFATKADMYRLLRIQIGIITGTVVASSGAVVALIKLLP